MERKTVLDCKMPSPDRSEILYVFAAKNIKITSLNTYFS